MFFFHSFGFFFFDATFNWNTSAFAYYYTYEQILFLWQKFIIYIVLFFFRIHFA